MQLNNITKNFNSKTILNNVSFNLSQNEVIGLVGPNGSGKSTLLKIISGQIPADKGKVKLNNETAFYLNQEISPEFYNLSVVDYLKQITNLTNLEAIISNFEQHPDEANMEDYGNALEEYLKKDGYNFESNLSFILAGLNFDEPLDKKIKELSGGEKMKILLAAMLLSNDDIFLLDEPTNNLDIEAITWLEKYLKSLNKQMIIVSHDEEFLNNLTTKIIELDGGKIKEYNLSYYAYVEYKELEYTHALEAYENAKEKKSKIKQEINTAKKWASKGMKKKSSDNDKIAANYQKEQTKKTAGKISRLNKELDEVEIDSDFRKKEKITFFLKQDILKGNKDIKLESLVCGYDSFHTDAVDLTIPFGSKVLIEGSNGVGKTTLMKTITGGLKPISGNVIIGSSAKIGYISQNTYDDFSEDDTIYTFLTKDKTIDKGYLFTLLDKFNISYEDKDKKYKELSPGMRTRVNLARLALEDINILLLDEVTNHLDIEAIKIIEEVIDTFKGTIICITHNRNFKSKLNADLVMNMQKPNLSKNNKPKPIQK